MMSIPQSHRIIHLSLMVLLPLILAAPLRADPPTTSRAADCAPDFLTANIKDLENPDFFIREDASQRLMDCGPGLYSPLQEAFAKTTYHDLRRRIHEIVREVFLTQRLGPPRAFLGIQHTASNVQGQYDPRVPGDRTALSISHVFRGSAAHRAGLRPGDLIMMLNHVPGTVDQPALEFTNWFRQQRPGVQCTLGVFRGGLGMRFEMGKSAGFEPEDFRSIQAQVLRTQNDPRVPVGAAALQIQQLGKIDPRLGVNTGDLIVALDDQLLDPQNAWQLLMEWTGQFAKPGPGLLVDQDRNEQKRRDLRGLRGPRSRSLQILRGGQWLELSATLRRMPMFLQEQNPALTHTVDVAAAESAMSEFSDWWQTQFDTHGRLANPDDDPRWLLRPQRSWK